MITYPIAAAQASGIFDRILVSTDSPAIAEIAKYAGAEVPFLRPQEISGDHATTAEAVVYALDQLVAENGFPEHFCCIYATSPLLLPEHLQKSFDLMLQNQAQTIFSVTAFEAPLLRALKINEKGRLEMSWPENELKRSNDLPNFYHDAGQFYWHETRTFLGHKKIWGKDAVPFVIPRNQVQDIDNEEDWKFAECLYRFQNR